MIRQRAILNHIKPFYDSPEAIIITGMRRTGKTTLLEFIFSQTESSNKLILDLENPINRKYFEETNYERIKSSFMVLGLDFARRAYVFLDEIQLVRNLPSVVKYFIDHYHVKFFLTGSASFYLKNLFTESLAGRKYLFELFPLTFREFLSFKDSPLKLPDGPGTVTRPMHESISPLYDEYVRFGGFPGVVLKSTAAEKERALDEIFTSFFQLEIIQLGDFRKNEIVRDLMLLLAQRVGSLLDIQKISKELRIARPTLYDYLAFLEGTFFIKMIRPFSTKRNSEIRKMPKVYLCDSGLAGRLARLEEGRLFENSIFQNLRQKGELGFYRRKNGVEIDFILNKEDGYEVKITPQPRDMNLLSRLALELRLKTFRIVSHNYTKLENAIYGFMI
jgi:predicted AAA+ superfamily ATPase